MSGARLVLEDGVVCHGEPLGAQGVTTGEAGVCTAMTGYQETLTDPSYHRQVIIMTAPHIGNTGWNSEDDESERIWAAGLVVRDPAIRPSNFRATTSLPEALAEQGIVGISGVDTRMLTRHLRERGVMRMGIFSGDENVGSDADLVARVVAAPPMAGANLVADVTVREPQRIPSVGPRRGTVVAVDLGIKTMTPRLLSERGVDVVVVPADATLADVLAHEPSGVFFSNGPGDPATMDTQVALMREVLSRRIPLFGICFGQQMFGRALGLDTYKLPYGHRGINQPVQDTRSGKVSITAQNHGFAVRAPEPEFDTEFGRARVTHVSLNDGVVEGLELVDAPAFSVQFHPEAAAGPHDAADLFDHFIELMEL